MIKQYYNFTTEEEIVYALQIFKKLEGLYRGNNKGDRYTTLFQDQYDLDFLTLVSLYTEKIKKILEKDIYIHSSAIVKYNVGDSMCLHSDIQKGCDEDILGMLVYFDDEYEGGQIVFPNQKNIVKIKPSKGVSITFPSHGDESMHYVEEVTSGVRYAMTFCFTTNKVYTKDCYSSLYM
jgi:hypothetical protein